MLGEIFKLLLLAIFIKTTKTKEALQELNHLSKELNLGDESRSSYPQKELHHQQLDENFIEDDVRSNLDEQTVQSQDQLNRKLIRGRKSHLQQQKTLKHQNQQKRNNSNVKRIRHSKEETVKKHKELNKNHVGDSSRQEQKTQNERYQEQSKTRISIEIKQKSAELYSNMHRIPLSEDLIPSHLDEQNTPEQRDRKQGHLDERTVVTDNEFAYMAAVIKGGAYVCAGALIDENWVLTAADGVYLMKEAIRFLRIRLGSINYKKGGMLFHVKNLEIHPYFNSSQPTYDLALIMLSKPVRYTPTIRSIRLQITPKEITATHFIVTSWAVSVNPMSKANTSKILSAGFVKHHRVMSATHLHPSDPEECVEELMDIGAVNDSVMCLETGVKDTCTRDVGAPVVINGLLWGIISSWIVEHCDEEDAVPIFASLVSAKYISTWIHATVHGHSWHPKNK